MPKHTRVHRCVNKLKRRFGKKSGAPYAICQKSTKQSYKSGRKIKKTNKK